MSNNQYPGRKDKASVISSKDVTSDKTKSLSDELPGPKLPNEIERSKPKSIGIETIKHRYNNMSFIFSDNTIVPFNDIPMIPSSKSPSVDINETYNDIVTTLESIQNIVNQQVESMNIYNHFNIKSKYCRYPKLREDD
eukprot:CAMPEP_0201590334 /NCGR_PEP_ID=MMETSP0190_2-20130828/176667_1 /ASSEMBLY_ACC=CAM_ASM_000263 /TAXON_ID=37353 /ORGANISM="Rosalina sp." /LENGTH=137 /DNA_ID=CAMNT_0048046281 /DNA_START=28 /DNA_END=438 /DNA_ORIENTATION=+